MKKNAKKNNKGFSLVELIIVVAIMAILIGVLGGQYLKFVERSRQSADKSNVDEIIRAVQIYSADPEAQKTVVSGASVTINTTKTTINEGEGGDGAIAQALQDAGIVIGNDGTKLKLKSKEWDGDAITITFTVANGQITTTVTPDGVTD